MARGEVNEDKGFWLMIMMEGKFSGPADKPSRFRWWLDMQPRFLDSVNGLQQGLFRPGIGYELGETTTAWIGYARVYTSSKNGSSSNEDRIWQQYLWRDRVGAFGFQSRTRLEQRFLDTGSETGWRLRQFVKASWNFPNESRFSIVGYDEIFLDLNDTGWGQSTGFAQNRLFVGIGMKLDDEGRTKIEVGYLNQYIEGGATDRMNHLLSINVFFNF